MFLGLGGSVTIDFIIKRYNTSNVLQSTTPYTDATPGTTYTHTAAGYYTIEIEPGSADVNFQMWAWGGGGGTANNPSPGLGGAGGGVRGTKTFTGGDTITFLVGGGGKYDSPTDNISSAFPDGGDSSSSGYRGPGGGRSSIYDGVLPYANRDSTPNTFLLIGGGGGGGCSFMSSGGNDGRAGYPSGAPGGSYYPKDGAGTISSGGTQSAGGAGGGPGRSSAGVAGAKYSGGGVNGTNGGGGGGGYYGGGSGGGYYAMGAGGSGYIHPSVTNTASFTATQGPPAYGGTGSEQSVDDPSNPGIKPASAGWSGYGPTGNAAGGSDGVVIFKVI